MPSVLSHAIAGFAIAYAAAPRDATRAAIGGAVCAVLPDADAITFWLGTARTDALAHRGLTHSLLVAALTGLIAAVLAFRQGPFWRLATCLFLATASHGLLDALTNGGWGVAFLAPFNETRYFFPVRPIRVSPISPAAFFSSRGWWVIQSEMLWVWAPSGLAMAVARWARG